VATRRGVSLHFSQTIPLMLLIFFLSPVLVDKNWDFQRMSVPHATRYYGSHLLVAGVPLTDVSKRMGHVNPHVTASRPRYPEVPLFRISYG
jgi:hypothetical protein